MMKPSKLREAVCRPRVEGDREVEILGTTLEVLAEAGYDRLTMDAVSSRARVSKATLYRRWQNKPNLVIDALLCDKEPAAAADTGTLRGDLIETFCGMGGITDTQQLAVLGSVITAISRDAEFARQFREQFIGPKVAITDEIYDRAQRRGEIRDDADLDVIAPALAGIVLHRLFLLGEPPTRDLVTRVVDHVILPAVSANPAATSAPTPKE